MGCCQQHPRYKSAGDHKRRDHKQRRKWNWPVQCSSTSMFFRMFDIRLNETSSELFHMEQNYEDKLLLRERQIRAKMNGNLKKNTCCRVFRTTFFLVPWPFSKMTLDMSRSSLKSFVLTYLFEFSWVKHILFNLGLFHFLFAKNLQ